MKDVVLRVNVAAPVQVAGKAVGFVLRPFVAMEKHIARESARAALQQMMETDEGKLQLFNMLLAAGVPQEKTVEE